MDTCQWALCVGLVAVALDFAVPLVVIALLIWRRKKNATTKGG